MDFLTNARGIQPQILPQTVTRFNGERLVMTLPSGWREENRNSKQVSISSATGEAKATLRGFRCFKTSVAFENWLFASVPFRYKEVGSALVHIPTRQVGIGRRLAVNKLDIVIREYEYGSNQMYLGLAGVRLQNYSVQVVYVVFKTKWNAATENRTIFENCVKTVRIISKN
jgi:hypothetical protein